MPRSDDKQARADAAAAREQAAREQRLAKALRDNLRRRKAPGSTPPNSAEDDIG